MIKKYVVGYWVSFCIYARVQEVISFADQLVVPLSCSSVVNQKDSPLPLESDVSVIGLNSSSKVESPAFAGRIFSLEIISAILPVVWICGQKEFVRLAGWDRWRSDRLLLDRKDIYEVTFRSIFANPTNKTKIIIENINRKIDFNVLPKNFMRKNKEYKDDIWDTIKNIHIIWPLSTLSLTIQEFNAIKENILQKWLTKPIKKL